MEWAEECKILQDNMSKYYGKKWGGEVYAPNEKSKLNMKKKLIIFAVYTPTGTQSEVRGRTRLAEIRSMMINHFNSIGKQFPSYHFEVFVFPSTDNSTKMEKVFEGEENDFFELPGDFKLETEPDETGVDLDDFAGVTKSDVNDYMNHLAFMKNRTDWNK
jgi:hypothetical protein